MSRFTQCNTQYFWRSPLVLTMVASLLIACDETSSENNVTAPADEQTPAVDTNCPTSDYAAIKFDPNAQDYFPDIFDFAPDTTILATDTVTFQTPNHDLVYCRANQTWAIQLPSNPPTEEEFNFDELADPPLATVDINGQNFSYRATLDPNPFPNYNVPPERVIFEISPPETSEPFILELYSIAQLRQSELGYDLGVPEITHTVQVDDSLFFVVNSEQGEGFNGFTTLIRYDINSNNLEKAQPINLIGEQITDMVMTQTDEDITFWFGTKYSAEGASWIPAKGLVIYTFTLDDWQEGTTSAYSVHNSPLVGAIPSDLTIDGENIWVATGSGICQFPWQAVQSWDAWDCWDFKLEAEVPTAGIPLYGSLLGSTPQSTLTPTASETIEVYWWSPIEPVQFEENAQRVGRYEVAYGTGLGVTLPEGGYTWERTASIQPTPPWETDVFWPGREWHWAGDRFMRSFDEVTLNFLSIGPIGISSGGYTDAGILDVNAMRGDLKLVSLSSASTTIQYFSGWVEDQQLQPIFSVVPSNKTNITPPNPLEAIAPTLETF